MSCSPVLSKRQRRANVGLRIPEWMTGRRAVEPPRRKAEGREGLLAKAKAGQGPFSPQLSEPESKRVGERLKERAATGFERAASADCAADEPYPERMSLAARQLTARLRAATQEGSASRPHLAGTFQVLDEVLSFHLRNNALTGDGEAPRPFPELRDELTLQVGIGVNASFRDFDAARQTLKKVEAIRAGLGDVKELGPAERTGISNVMRVWNNEKRYVLLPWVRNKDPFWTLNPRERALLALSWLDVPWGSGHFTLSDEGQPIPAHREGRGASPR
jgi:hypothetical protein